MSTHEIAAKCRELMPKAERVFAVTDETVGGIYGGRAVSSLEAAGYKVGLYTSPHLKDFRERIKAQEAQKKNAARKARPTG